MAKLEAEGGMLSRWDRWPGIPSPRLSLFALITLVATGTASGQTVIGTVLERGEGGPVAGAMVRLVDDRGATSSGWITREDGRFRLESVPGTYDLIIERIGFGRRVIRGLDLAADGITNIDVVVETAAIRLEGLTVESTGVGARESMRAGHQMIWEEARKALTAAVWTERHSRLRFMSCSGIVSSMPKPVT